MSGPMVMLGTKWPSITSTWIQSAAGGVDGADLLAEPGEIGGEDRRSNEQGAGHGGPVARAAFRRNEFGAPFAWAKPSTRLERRGRPVPIGGKNGQSERLDPFRSLGRRETSNGAESFMRKDVIVLGAGIVGVSVAVHLQQRGRSVLLVDRRGAGRGDLLRQCRPDPARRRLSLRLPA